MLINKQRQHSLTLKLGMPWYPDTFIIDSHSPSWLCGMDPSTSSSPYGFLPVQNSLHR